MCASYASAEANYLDKENESEKERKKSTFN
jgi:hypothetical protein